MYIDHRFPEGGWYDLNVEKTSHFNQYKILTKAIDCGYYDFCHRTGV